MTEHEYKENWNTRKIIDETLKSFHNEPSPKTLSELTDLKVVQGKLTKTQEFMTQEISEIKDLVKGLDLKLDNAIKDKADKSEVDDIKKEMKNFSNWKAYIMGMAVIVVFLLYALKDYLLGKL